MRGWLREGYMQLVEKRPLTIEGLRSTPFALDWETIAKIFYMREAHFGLANPYPARSNRYHLNSVTPPDLSLMVTELFSAELEVMEDTGHPVITEKAINTPINSWGSPRPWGVWAPTEVADDSGA